MKLLFHENFNKDLSSLGNAVLAKQIKKLVFRLESASNLSEIPNVKKMQGGPNFFRVRIGDYRVGITKQGNTITLMRVLHRKEIYRYFP